ESSNFLGSEDRERQFFNSILPCIFSFIKPSGISPSSGHESNSTEQLALFRGGISFSRSACVIFKQLSTLRSLEIFFSIGELLISIPARASTPCPTSIKLSQ